MNLFQNKNDEDECIGKEGERVPPLKFLAIRHVPMGIRLDHYLPSIYSEFRSVFYKTNLLGFSPGLSCKTHFLLCLMRHKTDISYELYLFCKDLHYSKEESKYTDSCFVDSVRDQKVNTCELLLYFGANPKGYNYLSLTHASRNGNLRMFMRLFYLIDEKVSWTNGVSIDTVNVSFNTKLIQCLYTAVSNKHLSIVRFLESTGMNIHANNEYAFQLSIETMDLKLIEFFLLRGASVNIANRMALDCAIRKGNLGMVKLLVKYGGDVTGFYQDAFFHEVYLYRHKDIYEYICYVKRQRDRNENGGGNENENEVIGGVNGDTLDPEWWNQAQHLDSSWFMD